MNKEFLTAFLYKKVKIIRKNNFFNMGILKSFDEKGIYIDDKKTGPLFIEFNDIKEMCGAKK